MNVEAEIVRALRGAVACRETPGAVCVVGTSRRVLLREAVGWRMLAPERRPMRPDTLFDVASLTKVVATTPCVMRLIALRELRLRDPLGRFFPQFRRGARRAVTVERLLLHTSGLPAHRAYWKLRRSRNETLAVCLAEPLVRRPGEAFEYSDPGFIILGALVERVSGESLADFAAREIFVPMGMDSTRFGPPPSSWRNCAATEIIVGKPLCGVVHDENARALGGVAGHAGVFSTAADLARFCRTVLQDRGGWLRPRAVPGGHRRVAGTTRRALGWDVESPYSCPKGHLFGPKSFGHTGFTGVSLWLDPRLDAFVALLTNRVHLGREANINALRSRIGTLAALLALHPR